MTILYLVLFAAVIAVTIIITRRKPKAHPPYSRRRRSKLPFYMTIHGQRCRKMTRTYLPISNN